MSISSDPSTFLESERAQPAGRIDHRVDVGRRLPAKPAQDGGDPKVGKSRPHLVRIDGQEKHARILHQLHQPPASPDHEVRTELRRRRPRRR